MTDPKTTIDKLTEQNWVFWKKSVRVYLLSKGLWELVTGTEVLPEAPAPSADARKTFVERKYKALHIIVNSVSDSVNHLIPAEPDEPHDVWTALQAHFESRSAFNILTLNEQLLIPCTDKDDAIEWVKKRQDTYLRLAAVGQNVDGTTQTMSTLSALPPSFAMLKTSLTTQVVTAGLSLENLLDHVKNFKRQSTGESSESTYFSSQQGTFRGSSTGSKSKRKQKGQSRGGSSHGGWRGGARGGGSGYSSASSSTGEEDYSSDDACWECGGTGHFRQECPTFLKRKQSQKDSHSTTFVDFPKNTTLMSAKGLAHRHGHVVMDSGASSHMTFAGHLLTNYKEFTSPETVSFGNGSCATVMGVGDLKLKSTHNKRDSVVILSKCLYVPDLSCHVIAMSTVVSCRGRTAEFRGNSAVVKGPGGQVLLRGHLVNGVYLADVMVPRAASMGSVRSPPAYKVSAAYLGECGQGTVYGERLMSFDKSSDSTFQRSPSPVMENRRDSTHTNYGQNVGTTHMLNGSRPPCMVPKGRAKGQPFGHSTFLSSCFSAEPSFDREGDAHVERPATGYFVEKEAVQEGAGFDKRLQELQGVIWRFQSQLAAFLGKNQSCTRQSGHVLPVSPSDAFPDL